MNKPMIKGYNFSKDYEKLWDIINDGYRVPAWILYSDEYKEPIYDIVEVRINPYGEVNIGTRGIGYSGFDEGKNGFLMICEMRQLQFIIPNDYGK